MTIPQQYQGKYFYHFTHIDNLDSILKNGLISTNEKNRLGLSHKNIANENIQERRAQMRVPVEPRGTVHDYVPFYFCSTNPMLLGLTNNKNIDQPYLIFFAVPFEVILNDSVIFTDASANTAKLPNFYNQIEDLDKLNWEVINSTKWGTASEDIKHKKMAEVLIHKSVPLEWIEYIIVWNDNFFNKVKEKYAQYGHNLPQLTFIQLNNRYFYFTKFAMGRARETLTTGPNYLLGIFNNVIEFVSAKREENDKSYTYKSIESLLEAIDLNFSSLNEMRGIFELECENEIHDETVSDHTLRVVSNLINNSDYNLLNKNDQDILKLSAYLHDIGKGPHEKWPSKRQKVYRDHPVDSLKMAGRILVEEIENLSEYEIRMICLLVAYHDLLGEIIGKGRNKEQLFAILENEKEFDMLNCLSYADVLSFNNYWHITYSIQIGQLKKEFLEQLGK